MPDLDTPITTTEQLQEKIDASLGPRLQRERDKFKDYDDLVKFKADSEAVLNTANERISDLESENSTLAAELGNKELEVTRASVAADKKVPSKWITGSTKEEMEASADEWLADVKAAAKPGTVPWQGTGEPGAELSSYEAGQARAAARYSKQT